MRLLPPTLAKIVPKGTKQLSKEQEQTLFNLLKEARKKQKSKLIDPIYRLIVELNIGLIHMYLKQRRNPYPDLYEDLIQEGVFGLYRAIDGFEPERNLRFSTYAWQWIRAKVGRAIDEEGLDRTAPITGASSEYQYGRRGTKRKSVVSLDQTISSVDDNEITLGEVVSGDEDVEKNVLDMEARWYVNRSAKRVAERSKDKRVPSIFQNRILAEDPETLEQMGSRENISRERIRQIEAKIIDQLAEDLVKLGYAK